MIEPEREPATERGRRRGMARTAPRLLAVALIAGLAVAPLAACASDDDPDAGGADPTTTAADAGSTTEDPDAAAPDDPDAPVSSPDDGDDGTSSPGSPGDDAATTVAPDPGAAPGDDLPPPIPAGDAETLVGLTEAEAEDAAAADGWTLRVVRRDGEDLASTDDYSPTRVNVAVDEGVVVQIMSIG